MLVGCELKRYDAVYYEDVPCEGGTPTAENRFATCGDPATCTVVEREDLSALDETVSEIEYFEVDYCAVHGGAAYAECQAAIITKS